ncbi:portal protein [Vibrio panuliri]|uniref:Phage tail protein n=1 Tax=Vibrio panuliri TaxID=1381081 RepID=A0ABX3FIK3_9VIBR|nr:portal protein [Vibrio panuliri]KAB1460887.1 phage tail protein [Vibrio panuliri]OLQ91640.1 hypothetical protein BIY20_09565 [Vibrio panuliri]
MATRSIYEKLSSEREPYVTRARVAAKLTIPSLFTEETQNTATVALKTPYQGVGAQGVKSLANKLLMALMPPNRPFFRMVIPDAKVTSSLERFEQAKREQQKGEIETKLSKVERMIMGELEVKQLRTALFEALKQLIVCGNVLVHISDKAVKVFRLDKYVVKRDQDGKPKLVIVKESVDIDDLPTEVQAKVKPDNTDDKKVDLYTHVERRSSKWHVYQKAGDVVMPKSKGSYPLDACPWLALRMVQVDGEDYGRSHVEEHMGDLKALENLEKSIQEGALAASRLIFMVRPNSTVRVQDLQQAVNGGFVKGNVDDVIPLQIERYHQMSSAKELAATIRQSLAMSFLMSSGIQRQAERVTAEEIRVMANELETTLGGVYSLLSNELQAPIIAVEYNRLKRRKTLPDIGIEATPEIVSGMEALGRTEEMSKMNQLIQNMAALGEDVLVKYVNVDEVIKRYAAALGVETDGLIKDSAQRQQEAEQEAETQALAQAMPQIATNSMQ